MPPSEIVRGAPSGARDAGGRRSRCRPWDPARRRSRLGPVGQPEPPILDVKDLVAGTAGGASASARGASRTSRCAGSRSHSRRVVPRGRRREREWQDDAGPVPRRPAPAALRERSGSRVSHSQRLRPGPAAGCASTDPARLPGSRQLAQPAHVDRRIVRRPLRQFFDLSRAEELARVPSCSNRSISRRALRTACPES